MQAKYFVLLREPSDLLPYLTFMVFVGCYGGKACSGAMAEVASKCQIPHIVLLFSHRLWMESKQIGFSPSLSRRIWQTQTRPSSCRPGLPQCKKRSACAELQIYIM